MCYAASAGSAKPTSAWMKTSEMIMGERIHPSDTAARSIMPIARPARSTSWQEHVAQYAAGNSRLGSGAVHRVRARRCSIRPAPSPAGFHFRGGSSSTGKTTALIVAGSAWGGGGIRGFIRTWRATVERFGRASPRCIATRCCVSTRWARSIAVFMVPMRNTLCGMRQWLALACKRDRLVPIFQ